MDFCYRPHIIIQCQIPVLIVVKWNSRIIQLHKREIANISEYCKISSSVPYIIDIIDMYVSIISMLISIVLLQDCVQLLVNTIFGGESRVIEKQYISSLSCENPAL